MIQWLTHHIETLPNGALALMRIGVPSPDFQLKQGTDSLKFFYTLDVKKQPRKMVKAVQAIIREPEFFKEHSPIRESLLYESQHKHFNHLFWVLKNNFAAIDASETGTGKTPVACAVSKHLKLTPAIVCPLPAISTWLRWLKIFGVTPLFVGNYEAFKGQGNRYGAISASYYPYRIIQTIGSQYLTARIQGHRRFKTFEQAIRHIELNGYPTIKSIIKRWEKINGKRFPKGKCREISNFTWQLPENIFLIFDEAHKCKGPHTQNAKMLAAAKKYRVLMLSATIAQSPRDMRSIGYLLDLHVLHDFNSWSCEYGCRQNFWKAWECRDPIGAMQKLSEQIFPARGSRLRIEDMPDFPETQIKAEPYESRIKQSYNRLYDVLLNRISELEEEGQATTEILTEITRFRQAAELMKVDLYATLTRDAVENGLSVALFVNYTETRLALQKVLRTNCAVYGSQDVAERENNIEQFQRGLHRIIILMSQAGGISISLHDVYGNYSRMSVISPTYDSRIFKQVLGRVHRAGAKSKSLQRIVYLSGTIEDAICKSVNKKLDNISALNDGDLMEEDLLKLKK